MVQQNRNRWVPFRNFRVHLVALGHLAKPNPLRLRDLLVKLQHRFLLFVLSGVEVTSGNLSSALPYLLRMRVVLGCASALFIDRFGFWMGLRCFVG